MTGLVSQERQGQRFVEIEINMNEKESTGNL
jgi:hypothetical protein